MPSKSIIFDESQQDAKSASCSIESCGAIDPVNDPAYNMRETLKNTLLIEQHLSDKAKDCRQCLVKHFLLSIGLLEEAVWMAGIKVTNYQYLSESVDEYKDMFNEWFKDPNDDQAKLHVLDKLREWRRKVMLVYYPTN
jgi:hypothetical protein